MAIYIEKLSGEKSLLELLQEKRLISSAPCDGKGNCGRCRVRFISNPPVPTVKEQKLLTESELQNGIRLACAVREVSDCEVVLLEFDEEKMDVLTEGDRNIVAQKVRHSTQEYAIAIDIGTTTLVAELFDINTDECMEVVSAVNHQRAYGADVISRINAANEGKLEGLRTCICEDIVKLIKRLQRKPHKITQVVIVGNTTMCHLLRGLSCEGLGSAPFVPSDISWCETDTKMLLGMDECTIPITIFPGISAFVGADIVAGIFASDLAEKEGANLLLDIGTNGEMVFAEDGKLFVTSTAAGPVFEGGNISYGVPAIPGAISEIEYNKKEARGGWNYKTIGDMAPIGLCGSGIVDLVHALRENGFIDENGTLFEPWFAEGVPIENHEVVFSQGDIRQVQMAKAAIRAGIELLLAEKTQKQEIGQEKSVVTVYLAGGFGQKMDVRSAVGIGMFPKTFIDCTVGIGNSALCGAKKYLMSGEVARRKIDAIVASAREINLAKHPMFEEWYIQYMLF